MPSDSSHPSIHHHPTVPNATQSSTCPFCTIISNYPPVDPLSDPSNACASWSPDKLDPPAFVLLSTKDVVAFLDIAPLARGHVLVTPRRHRVKVGDLSAREGAEIGRILPLLARAVIRAVMPDIAHDDVDYNVVQNNGPGAAQVVPHVHFHIIPRFPLNYRSATTGTKPLQSSNKPQHTSQATPESKPKPTPATGNARNSNSNTKTYEPNPIPTGIRQSYILFGRGMRDQLDEQDAASLVETMRSNVADEFRAAIHTDSDTDTDTDADSSTGTNTSTNGAHRGGDDGAGHGASMEKTKPSVKL